MVSNERKSQEFAVGMYFMAPLIIVLMMQCYYQTAMGQNETITDPKLRIEVVAEGLEAPTKIAFLGDNDILVMERLTGLVKRIVNGTILPTPLLDADVAYAVDRGMLGIAVSMNFEPPYVFIYYTEAQTNDGDDKHLGKEPLGNRLYRYELADNKLINPKLLLEIPSKPSAEHNGGGLILGPDGNLYLTTGDNGFRQTMAQNTDLNMADLSSGIIRFNHDGEPVRDSLSLGKNFPLDYYYAYGIRNSYGLAFDPVTGRLWDTENGPDFGDEINLVEPGFNSGWRHVQGIWKRTPGTEWEEQGNVVSNIFKSGVEKAELIDFGGRGNYSSPEFTWNYTVAPTALVFFNSSKMGYEYANDLFVADVNHGRIYHFDLEGNRTELALKGPLFDKVAANDSELEDYIFGTGFRGRAVEEMGITDLQLGPDGFLYIVSYGLGKIYRVVPSD